MLGIPQLVRHFAVCARCPASGYCSVGFLRYPRTEIFEERACPLELVVDLAKLASDRACHFVDCVFEIFGIASDLSHKVRR